MDDAQLMLDDMPKPTTQPAHALSDDDSCVHKLINSPCALPHDLLVAFQNVGLDPRTRDALLQHPSIDLVDLDELIGAWTENLKDRVAFAVTNLMLLKRWASSPVVYERAVVAMNPFCPDDLAIMLAGDPEPAVRMNALCCPQLPRSLLRDAATDDPDDDVREFARWLITSTRGRALTSGERYFRAEGSQDVVRVIAWGITRRSSPPA